MRKCYTPKEKNIGQESTFEKVQISNLDNKNFEAIIILK